MIGEVYTSMGQYAKALKHQMKHLGMTFDSPDSCSELSLGPPVIYLPYNIFLRILNARSAYRILN
jgi:hypothetical protein